MRWLISGIHLLTTLSMGYKKVIGYIDNKSFQIFLNVIAIIYILFKQNLMIQ